MDQREAKPLADTMGANSPFFSPDGQWVGFFADGKLKTVSLWGGAALTLCDTGFYPRGASWGTDGTIVFTPSFNSGLFRISADGGTAEPLTTPDLKNGVKAQPLVPWSRRRDPEFHDTRH
jgi:serine/threonine-protein kinase